MGAAIRIASASVFALASLFLLSATSSCDSRSAPENLNSILNPIRQKYDLPALAAAVVTSKGLVAVGAVGVRKYGTNTPVTINDEFHLGSDTKAMTATLLATLVEQGKLSWTTTIEQVFPELAGKMNPAYRKVTLEQLLAHRAGLSDESWVHGKTFLDMHHLPGTPREQRAVYVSMILTERPDSEPGTKFLYSNRSYAIAGAMAERVADEPWEDLMRHRIFQPLGMDTCGFGAMGTPGEIDQPWQHKRVADEAHYAIEPDPLADNPPVIGPGGTVHCSIGDWGKFVTAHLLGEKGKPGILKPETFKRLHTPPFGGEYGYGWFLATRDWAGGPALNHTGTNLQNYSVVWMAPRKDFAVLVATNQGDTFDACDATAWALITHFTHR